MPDKSIDTVLSEWTDRLIAIPGVEGTAEGLASGKPCILVFTARKKDDLAGKIPSAIEGYPVVIDETGTFAALS